MTTASINTNLWGSKAYINDYFPPGCYQNVAEDTNTGFIDNHNDIVKIPRNCWEICINLSTKS